MADIVAILLFCIGLDLVLVRKGLVDFLTETKGYDVKDAYEAGALQMSTKDNTYFDPMAGRVVIPISDGKGVVIGIKFSMTLKS